MLFTEQSTVKAKTILRGLWREDNLTLPWRENNLSEPLTKKRRISSSSDDLKARLKRVFSEDCERQVIEEEWLSLVALARENPKKLASILSPILEEDLYFFKAFCLKPAFGARLFQGLGDHLAKLAPDIQGFISTQEGKEFREFEIIFRNRGLAGKATQRLQQKKLVELINRMTADPNNVAEFVKLYLMGPATTQLNSYTLFERVCSGLRLEAKKKIVSAVLDNRAPMVSPVGVQLLCMWGRRYGSTLLLDCSHSQLLELLKKPGCGPEHVRLVIALAPSVLSGGIPHKTAGEIRQVELALMSSTLQQIWIHGYTNRNVDVEKNKKIIKLLIRTFLELLFRRTPPLETETHIVQRLKLRHWPLKFKLLVLRATIRLEELEPLLPHNTAKQKDFSCVERLLPVLGVQENLLVEEIAAFLEEVSSRKGMPTQLEEGAVKKAMNLLTPRINSKCNPEQIGAIIDSAVRFLNRCQRRSFSISDIGQLTDLLLFRLSETFFHLFPSAEGEVIKGLKRRFGNSIKLKAFDEGMVDGTWWREKRKVLSQ